MLLDLSQNLTDMMSGAACLYALYVFIYIYIYSYSGSQYFKSDEEGIYFLTGQKLRNKLSFIKLFSTCQCAFYVHWFDLLSYFVKKLDKQTATKTLFFLFRKTGCCSIFGGKWVLIFCTSRTGTATCFDLSKEQLLETWDTRLLIWRNH